MKKIPCIICNNKDSTQEVMLCRDTQLYIDEQDFHLVQCKLCGLFYLNPQPTLLELSKYYPSNYPPYLSENSVFSKSSTYNLLRAVKHFIIPTRIITVETKMPRETDVIEESKTVLDFGCGNGRYLLGVQEQHPSWKLYGFDIGANETVHSIGEYGEIKILIGDNSTLWTSFPEKKFDIINLSHVLEHLNEPKYILKKLRKLLKNDGEIHIEVPNIDTVKFKIFGKNFSNLDAPRHLYHFSPTTLTKLCEQSGLYITKLEITGTMKSTLRSIYTFLYIKKRTLNPFAYMVINILTRLIGEQRINTEAMSVVCNKLSKHRKGEVI